jgi:type VI secretion system secreted protein Hcp
MPIDSNATSADPGSASDVFLSVTTKRAGKIKGESRTDGHEDDIEVRNWSWGVDASSAWGSGQATARRQYAQLVVAKQVDSASTGLLAALASNDEVSEAKLTMRKAGGDVLDYYVMTLAGARVVSVAVAVDVDGVTTERVSFSYTSIDIEYQRQASAGDSGGSYSFSDDVASTS